MPRTTNNLVEHGASPLLDNDNHDNMEIDMVNERMINNSEFNTVVTDDNEVVHLQADESNREFEEEVTIHDSEEVNAL